MQRVRGGHPRIWRTDAGSLHILLADTAEEREKETDTNSART
jgi:hypothetical protein